MIQFLVISWYFDGGSKPQLFEAHSVEEMVKHAMSHAAGGEYVTVYEMSIHGLKKIDGPELRLEMRTEHDLVGN